MNFLKRVSFIKIKIFILSTLTLFVFLFTALIVYEEYQEFQREIGKFKKEYIDKQKSRIKKETLKAISFMDYKLKSSQKALPQLKKEIIDAIEYMRDKRDGSGYIFIYDFNGTCIADPILKENKGKNLLNLTILQKRPIKELIEVSKQPGGGYVSYFWNKPTTHEISPKLSYAKAFEPFGWMVGSGVYLDDIASITKQRQQAHKDKMIKYIINIITLSFILFSITLIILKYISNIIENSLAKIRYRFGEAADRNIYIYTDDIVFKEFKEIAGYANKMIKIIKERTNRLKELNRTLEQKVIQKTKKLSESKEFAEELLKNQDRFIKTAIHEINTPLSIILTNIDLLKLDGFQKKELTNIESGVKIIHNIYNDLSYLIKKDRIEYKKEPIDFSAFLKSRIEFFKEIASSNRLKIRYRIKDGLKLHFNPIELQRIIDNNISNAIKYAYKGSTIYIHLDKKSPLEFKIATKSDKIRNKEGVFNEYYREDRAKGGFGLGLALVKQICEKNGCEIELKSKLGYNIFIYRF